MLKARLDAAQRERQSEDAAAAELRDCTERLRAKPSEVDFDPEQRALTLMRVKAEPALFVRTPGFNEQVSSTVRGYRRALANSRFPWDLLKRITPRFLHAQDVGREVVLREGYFYSDSPELAQALYEFVGLEHLFSEPKLWLERGAQRIAVEKRENKYVYASGPERGQPARLLLYDRVWRDGDSLGPPLHRELRGLRAQLGFDRLRVLGMDGEWLIAELRYGDSWVRTVLASNGAQLELLCDDRGSAEPQIRRARARANSQGVMVSALRRAMLEQVADELPFDEPRNEWGQQDGHLRFRWLLAYYGKQDRYRFNFDSYPVFTEAGRPKVPQVCVDFITETFEHASGTWFLPRGERPGRSAGAVDFDNAIEGNRRQVPVFLEFAKKHPELFDYRELPSSERVQYKFKQRFFRSILAHADEFEPGDVLVIRGYAPWDHYSVPHYHAFFVYETDPMSGVPLLLAGNAGVPRVQSWEAVMGRTPLRSIHYRVRPTSAWTQRVQSSARDSPVPPLVTRFR